MRKSQPRIAIILGLALALGLAHWPLQAETLKGIRQRGRLTVAVKDNTRPLGFRDNQGQLQGLEIDIARRLSTEILGSPDKVDLLPVANQDRLRVLLENRADVTIARLTINRARSRIVDFSRPYYKDSTAILTNQSKIRQRHQLDGQPIAVLPGSSSAYEGSYQLNPSQWVAAASYQEAKALLDGGKVAAFVADRSVLVGWMQEYPRQYYLLDTVLAFDSIGVAVPRGRQYDELWYLIDQAIGRWEKEGWLRQRQEFWGL
jgi:polar amino acid transport system substrate-binding protein